MNKKSAGALIADCTWSLSQAVAEAGGRVGDGMLDMTLREFISEVAGRNGIRFVHEKPKEGDV